MGRAPIILVMSDVANIGDMALALQNVQIEQAQGQQIHLWQWIQPNANARSLLERKGVRILHGKAFARSLALATRSRVVFGGGQMVRDNASVASLLALLMLCWTATQFGLGVKTRGLGVSSLQSRVRRWLYGRILPQDISVRDVLSKHAVQTQFSKRHVTVTYDTMLHPKGRAPPPPFPKRSGVLIAVCRDPSENRGQTGLDCLSALRGAKGLTFLCHDPRPGRDETTANAIAKQHGFQNVKVTSPHDPAEALSAYGSALCVITNRLHAAIFGHLMETPVIVIQDGCPKLTAFANAHGLPMVRNMTELQEELGTIESPPFAAFRDTLSTRLGKQKKEAVASERIPFTT